VAAKTGDAPHFQADWLAFGRGFNRCDERRLSWGTPSAFATCAFAAKVGVIELDTSGQWFAGVALQHDLLQFVLDLPCGGLGHAEAAAQFRELLRGAPPRMVAGKERASA